MENQTEIKKACGALREMLKGASWLSGVGFGWDEAGEMVLRVNVTAEPSKGALKRIPSRIGGFPVKIRVTGRVLAR